jgi:hypothetical protein
MVRVMVRVIAFLQIHRNNSNETDKRNHDISSGLGLGLGYKSNRDVSLGLG